MISATTDLSHESCRSPRVRDGTDLTEAELLSGLRHAPDPRLITELVHRYQGVLLAFLIRLARDRETAADLCQHTWLKVLEAAHSGSCRPEAGKAFRNFLFTIARNHYLDRHVRNRGVSRIEYRGEQELEIAMRPEVVADDVERKVCLGQLAAHLTSALDALPPAQRDAVELWISGDTAQDSACALGVPRDTLLSRKKYAFAKLRLALEARGIVAETIT